MGGILALMGDWGGRGERLWASIVRAWGAAVLRPYKSVANGRGLGSVELKARDLGSDRGYTVGTWGAAVLGA
jgi:hypothetical protein